MLPYPIIRKLFSQFGLDVIAFEAVKNMLDRERAGQHDGAKPDGPRLGSLGLGAATIMARGTLAQKERWLPPVVTMEKVAAWAITEPDSGSDAFGGMKTYVRRDGDDYILNGQKTFITNGPYADTVIIRSYVETGPR
jgi:alkylation response protein AidB-like acyl-CoA dehydrogenase